MPTSPCSTTRSPRRKATARAPSAWRWAVGTSAGSTGEDSPAASPSSDSTNSAAVPSAVAPSAASRTSRSPSRTASSGSPARCATPSVRSASSTRGPAPASCPRPGGTSEVRDDGGAAGTEGPSAVCTIISRTGASNSVPYNRPPTPRACSSWPASSIRSSAAAESALRVLEGAGLFQGEREEGDGGVHDVARGGVQPLLRAHGEVAARAAAGAERLELDPVLAALGSGHGGAGRGGLVAQPVDLAGEPRGPAAGPLGGGGQHRARGVVEGGPAVEVGGEPGQQGGGALGRQRGPGQLALRLEPGGDRLVLVGRHRRGDGLADGDERGGAGHLQQWQPGRGRGGHQVGRHLACPRPTPKPSPTTPAAASRRTYAASAAGSPSSSLRPVVSSSSPPSRYGPGSSSSLVCTQRTSAPSRSPPARTVSFSDECWARDARVRGMRSWYGERAGARPRRVPAVGTGAGPRPNHPACPAVCRTRPSPARYRTGSLPQVEQHGRGVLPARRRQRQHRVPRREPRAPDRKPTTAPAPRCAR